MTYLFFENKNLFNIVILVILNIIIIWKKI